MDDIITVALAFDPTLCTMTEPLFCDIVLDGRVARGQTVAYRGRQLLPGGGPEDHPDLHRHRWPPFHGVPLQGNDRPATRRLRHKGTRTE